MDLERYCYIIQPSFRLKQIPWPDHSIRFLARSPEEIDIILLAQKIQARSSQISPLALSEQKARQKKNITPTDTMCFLKKKQIEKKTNKQHRLLLTFTHTLVYAFPHNV